MGTSYLNSLSVNFLCFCIYVVYVNYDLHKPFGLDVTSFAISTDDQPKPSGVEGKKSKKHKKHDDSYYEPILNASFYLYEITHTNKVGPEGKYGHVRGRFCMLDWTKQKTAPNTVPRYSDVINKSWKKLCQNDTSVRLDTIVKKARHFDKENPTKVHSLEKAGFIYHESRCGSTLASNMLTVADPEGHRVYGEPTVLHVAMKTGNKKLINDVLYMMGRSNDPKEKRVFYKFKSSLSRHMDVMPQDVPWIFFYRHPEEVLASHFEPTEIDEVVCLNSRNKTHASEIELATDYGKNFTLLTDPEVCAIRLASIVQGAINEHNRTKRGHFINYNSLPSSFWDTALPGYFHIKVNEAMLERMKAITGVYSKTTWTKKVLKWEKMAAEEKALKKDQKRAADKFMSSQYELLEELSASPDG